MKINRDLTPTSLKERLSAVWDQSARTIDLLEKEYDPSKGSPVYTRAGKYTTRGWTEWTQGFQYGNAILHFDATGEEKYLELGRNHTVASMAPHVSHVGVHDHGFNNVSTYGNLLRLMNEGRIPENPFERHFYEIALKVSGAVQANRYTPIKDGGEFLYSFNGPHSLFVDTIRSVRALMVSDALGHVLMSDHDEKIDLLVRGVKHGLATASFNLYYGEGRDSYDVWGRTAHEAIFNTNDGHFRCPNAQQGVSGFTTWTRGLSWAMCGFPEELEYLEGVPESRFESVGGKQKILDTFLKAAKATCDFFIANTAADGIPYWDTGAPMIHKLGEDLYERPADPFNEYEPVDSTAAAIGAQGLLRLGNYLRARGDTEGGDKYFQAGLTAAHTLFAEPYLSTEPQHQGLLLHSIYHRPNGWDYVPEGSKIPAGESSMWGDYHMRELALLIHRLAEDKPYYTFFGCVKGR